MAAISIEANTGGGKRRKCGDDGSSADRDVAELLSFFISRTDLRRLKLAGLVNITGVGLDPLRGYPLLEQIDLSLVKPHENPTLETRPALSPGMVINILDTIVRKDDSSLKHIQLPKHWRGGDNELVGAFLENYSRFLERRKLVCDGSVFTRSTRVGGKRVEHFAKCTNLIRNEVINGSFNGPLISDGSFRVSYGLQRRACSACLKTVCAECEENEYAMDYCSCCERVYCNDCQEVLYCEGDGPGRWCGVSTCITCAQVEKW